MDRKHIITIGLIFSLLLIIVLFVSKNSKKEGFLFNREHFLFNREYSDIPHNNGPSVIKADFDGSASYIIEDPLINSPVRYMSTNEFNYLIDNIKKICYNTIKREVSVCNEMGGFTNSNPKPLETSTNSLDKHQMTFNCISDVKDIETSVINDIADYLISYIKSRYNINLNSYAVIMDFKMNMELLENVIYPLLYSKLYTINGMNYFNDQMLKKAISDNLYISDTLYTTLMRRAIDVKPDTDNHM